MKEEWTDPLNLKLLFLMKSLLLALFSTLLLWYNKVLDQIRNEWK